MYTCSLELKYLNTPQGYGTVLPLRSRRTWSIDQLLGCEHVMVKGGLTTPLRFMASAAKNLFITHKHERENNKARSRARVAWLSPYSFTYSTPSTRLHRQCSFLSRILSHRTFSAAILTLSIHRGYGGTVSSLPLLNRTCASLILAARSPLHPYCSYFRFPISACRGLGSSMLSCFRLISLIHR
ncbi:hypothetical protein BC826DRAFT_484155 [Russula brevipes]|nr:hypothetical protein BC826DRAFT_484155 [Russula brevipes]